MMGTMDQTVGDIMSRDVVTILPEENLTQLLSVMQDCGFRHLPVVDDEDGQRLVGLVTERDLLWLTVSPLEPGAETRRSVFAEQTFVNRVMVKDVVTVTESAPASEAAKIMLDRKSGALPVVADDGSLVGIVTTSDLLRIVADH